MRISTVVAAALLLSAAGLASSPACADDGLAGHYQIRLRGLAVIPDASATVTVSGTNIGGTTSVTNSFIPEVDGTYFITDHIGVELIAGTTKHSVHHSIAGNVGSVWLLPPTLTAQYHFDPTGPFRPYVGAGINYTFFYSAHSATFAPISFSNNVGFALQAGADVPVGDGPYFLNFDVKKLFLSTTMKAAGGVVHASANLDPWIIGAGVGIRF
ncbi:MAG: OmpW family protein [Alphaproteobacteria bacterium]|nr:OmpW family protein [Alphaproteobacteria bacterium]MBL6940370.1 OmpW family protein [Alphaproteobacteria bacterium]MBL7099099.1 OmpW family protein [Alphaproteobacteria bacterium]